MCPVKEQTTYVRAAYIVAGNRNIDPLCACSPQIIVVSSALPKLELEL